MVPDVKFVAIGKCNLAYEDNHAITIVDIESFSSTQPHSTYLVLAD